MLSTLLIIGCIVSKTIGVKRYDVEAEALKLYGEDLHDVLAKFRRTPDYLRILNSKVASLRTRMGDIIIQTHFYYDQKLKEKVGDLLGINKSDLDQLASTTPADVKADTTAGKDKFFRDSGIRFRRQGGRKEESKTKASTKQETASQEQKKRVKVLDSYHKLSSNLTLAQRNSMKDLGFEFAGHLIHSLIRTMGGDDVEVKSTRHPFGGETADSKTTPTTRHVSVHEVTTLPTKPQEEVKSTQAGAVTSLDNRFMFK